MPICVLAAAALSIVATPAPLAGPAPQTPPRSEEDLRRAARAAIQQAMGPARTQGEFERDMLRRAGLPDLADIAAEGREVVQISLNDPYFMFAVPAIQIEKAGDDVTLTVFNRQGTVMTIPVDPDDWTRIYDRDLMQRTPPEPVATGDGPPPVIHTWIVRLGRAGGGESVTHSASGRAPGAEVAALAARIAVRSRPECKQDGEPFSLFHRCFTPPPS